MRESGSAFLCAETSLVPGRRDLARASVTRRASLSATDPKSGQPPAAWWVLVWLSYSAPWTCLLHGMSIPALLGHKVKRTSAQQSYEDSAARWGKFRADSPRERRLERGESSAKYREISPSAKQANVCQNFRG